LEASLEACVTRRTAAPRPEGGGGDPVREDRRKALGAALRENLKRRKEQARGRATGDAGGNDLGANTPRCDAEAPGGGVGGGDEG